ncbi:MAG: helicase [Gemmatimonadetes bacterium]|nr:helicase [Gemmatimonadota bacterium]
MRLTTAAREAIRANVFLAGGREVCFVGSLDAAGDVEAVRVAARGDIASVLALPGFARRGELLIHNHPSGVLDPSDADLAVAAGIHDNGVGFAIVNNEATELYVVVEVPVAPATTPLVLAEIDADLGPDGPVAATHPEFEDRASQRAMARAVARLYNEGGVGLIEAGTGVGKSLGYLVPALRWAAKNGERTVVSTNTINLQEQLVAKDLPFLKRALADQPVRFAMLKGWSNYVCLARLAQARSASATLFEDAAGQEVERLAEWAERTSDGSRADLATPPRPEVWDEIAAEPDLCPRMKCPHFDDCFLFKARRTAANADVIVVNHALLMADLAVRRSAQNWTDAAVLPAFNRLVVDEGHHLEDAALERLGASVSRRAVERLFGRLERKGRGLLPTLYQKQAALLKLAKQGDALLDASQILISRQLLPDVQTGRERAAVLFDILGALVTEAGVPQLRLTDEFAKAAAWQAGLERAFTDVVALFASLAQGLETLKRRLGADLAREEQLAPVLAEVRATVRRLEGAGDALKRALKPGADAGAQVRWLEFRGRPTEGNVVASAVPLDLEALLRDDLFGRLSTTIVTSATLTAGNRFEFTRGRLGLADADPPPLERQLPSPFDYASQALLVVPTDLPAPNADAAGHRSRVLTILGELVAASDGGCFALFTSHRELRAAAEMLRAEGLDRRWPLLVHGESSRHELLARFRDSGDAILLGTSSFWEGVDVPGRALRALLIAKLPFRVPTEPITAAQCERIESAGGDPFREYMLPHAALSLTQGFGRLIRSGTDRGVVVIADSRVGTKTYGRGLLAGLPPARRRIGRWAELRTAVEGFYAGRLGDADGEESA